MEYATETAELQARIKRLEDQLKTFRFIFVVVFFLVGSQLWMQTHPRAILTAGMVRASQFEVVDAAGKAVAELSRENGRTQLVLNDASYKPAAEFSVVGSDPSIVFYDGEQKRRALLGMMGDAPTLAIHDPGGEVRVLLRADHDGSVFWLKDKNGSATILGNAIDETRKLEIINGKVAPHDTVQTTTGASIRIQDAKRTILWKAP
jgi:hypothetical protein